LLITGALACIVVGWVFGAGKLREHINETSDIKIGAWWDWLLKVVVPAGLLFVVIYGGFMSDIPAPYGGYPRWAASMIWVILLVTLGLSFWLQAVKTKGPKEVSEE
jgi:NSS family neurotransmitter:Na+ symporter